MEKLQITQSDHFALAIEQSISLSPARISFLPNKLKIQQVCLYFIYFLLILKRHCLIVMLSL
jgi:hypothetical protein